MLNGSVTKQMLSDRLAFGEHFVKSETWKNKLLICNISMLCAFIKMFMRNSG